MIYFADKSRATLEPNSRVKLEAHSSSVALRVLSGSVDLKPAEGSQVNLIQPILGGGTEVQQLPQLLATITTPAWRPTKPRHRHPPPREAHVARLEESQHTGLRLRSHDNSSRRSVVGECAGLRALTFILGAILAAYCSAGVLSETLWQNNEQVEPRSVPVLSVHQRAPGVASAAAIDGGKGRGHPRGHRHIPTRSSSGTRKIPIDGPTWGRRFSRPGRRKSSLLLRSSAGPRPAFCSLSPARGELPFPDRREQQSPSHHGANPDAHSGLRFDHLQRVHTFGGSHRRMSCGTAFRKIGGR